MKRNIKNEIIKLSDKKNAKTIYNVVKSFRLKMEADKLVVEGRPDKALEKYNLSIALYKNVPTYIGRAIAYRELGEYELALSDMNILERFLQSKFMYEDYRIYFERGLVHERLGDMKSAFEDMKKFVSICQEKKIQFAARSKEETIKYIDGLLSNFRP